MSLTHFIRHRAKLFCKFVRDALRLQFSDRLRCVAAPPFVHQYISRVARYTPSSRPKNASRIKANLEIHKSSDDFSRCSKLFYSASFLKNKGITPPFLP